MNNGEKEYDMTCNKDFTQKIIQKYPDVFTDIGKLEGTVTVDL